MSTLWYGGKIYTMTEENDIVEAVVTDNGKIIDLGNKETLIHMYKDKITKWEDLNGSVMYPGFVDSHLHIIGHGEKLMHIDLSQMQSKEEVLEKVAERATELDMDEWLIAEGWNENQWDEKEIIHRKELDSVCKDNPVMLTRICRHAVIVNSKALQLAHICKDTENPQGGKIIKDDSGEPTGYLLDQAQELIKNVIPPISDQLLRKTTERAIQDLLSKGLVGGHTEDLAYYDGFARTLQAYQSILPSTFLFRAHLLVHHEVFQEMIQSGYVYGDGGEYTELGAMKIFSDGALGGRTAWLSEAYEDDSNNKGIPIHHQDDLEKLIIQARKQNHPIAIHAIGDKASEVVAKLIKKYPLTNGLRDRIIHAQVTNPDVIQLLKEIDVVLDIQPTFVASDFPWVIERIGESRAKQAYAWKTFLENGIHCAAGSDAPIEEVHPILGIDAFVNRVSSIDNQTYYPEQCLSVYEAVSLYTKGSAYVIGHEHDRGMIAKGYVADFTLLAEDLFAIDPIHIKDVQVVGTIVNEQWMYKRQES